MWHMWQSKIRKCFLDESNEELFCDFQAVIWKSFRASAPESTPDKKTPGKKRPNRGKELLSQSISCTQHRRSSHTLVPIKGKGAFFIEELAYRFLDFFSFICWKCRAVFVLSKGSLWWTWHLLFIPQATLMKVISKWKVNLFDEKDKQFRKLVTHVDIVRWVMMLWDASVRKISCVYMSVLLWSFF